MADFSSGSRHQIHIALRPAVTYKFSTSAPSAQVGAYTDHFRPWWCPPGHVDFSVFLYLENSRLCDGRLNLNADSTASQLLKPPNQIADFGLFLTMVEIVIAQFLIGLLIG